MKTGCEGLFGDGLTIAIAIKERIKAEVGVTCSVGVANSKVVAKTAADLKKPDAITVITKEAIPEKLAFRCRENVRGRATDQEIAK